MMMAKNTACGTTSSRAFTLIEILIAIVLVGLLGALFTGLRFGSVTPENKAKAFVERVNKLMQYGVRSAISTGQLHRVLFDFKNQQIRLEQKISEKSKGKAREAQKDFELVPPDFTDTAIPLSNEFEFENVYIEGNHDEIRSTGTTNDVWFYITPDGLTQRVIMNITLKGEDIDSLKQFGIKLNPFYGIFKIYDDFLHVD